MVPSWPTLFGGKPVFQCSGYIPSIDHTKPQGSVLSEDGTQTNPLTDFFYSNILLCRAPLLS